MGKGSAPSAPDPYATAQSQAYFGEQAAGYNKALNSTNVVGPTGSTSFAQTGTASDGAPQYTQTNTLSAPQQALLSGSENLGLAGQGAAGNALNTYNETQANNPLPNTGQLQDFGKQAQKAAYGAATADMDPHWDQQQEQMDASLRNSGAQPGTPAYDNAMKSFQADRASAYGQAENQAFGQGLNAQGQMISQIGQEQQIPLSEYQSLVSGSQPTAMAAGGAGAGSAGQGSVSAPDIMSAFNNQYQGKLAGYNANVASTNADVGALGTLAAAFLMA